MPIDKTFVKYRRPWRILLFLRFPWPTVNAWFGLRPNLHDPRAWTPKLHVGWSRRNRCRAVKVTRPLSPQKDKEKNKKKKNEVTNHEPIETLTLVDAACVLEIFWHITKWLCVSAMRPDEIMHMQYEDWGKPTNTNRQISCVCKSGGILLISL